MIKRMAALILVISVTAVFSLTACGGNEPENFQPDFGNQQQPGAGSADNNDPQNTGDDNGSDSQNTDSDLTEMQLNDVFYFKVGNVLIEMDQDITYVLSSLGEPPRGSVERPSCAFDGMDIIYGYDGFDIYTYPKGDGNHVHTINFESDSPVTSEGGIYMGVNLQDVFDAYGTEYEYNNGMYTFTRGLTTLQFYAENDIVWGITYGFIIE